ncbi:hypothetical protein RJ639_045489 [Escallonia herrerae]|uniref:C2H2-type domain-containing protein n=1 Tax=Escallonia herrerae TaxID=1293975 RepID=A0AA89AZ74_9ASTE|nr:hypothetical protein RJ639_045489 [Escallonia herrerae]
MKDDEELETLLGEIPHATSLNLHNPHSNGHSHDHVHGGTLSGVDDDDPLSNCKFQLLPLRVGFLCNLMVPPRACFLVDIHVNMSNFVNDFEEEEDEQLLSSAELTQSSNGSPSPTETNGETLNDLVSLKSRAVNMFKGKEILTLGNIRAASQTTDPDAEVVALSPRTLMATNRYVCEVCHKGFQRDQNLQLHRRGHNLPWKLKQRPSNVQVKKRVYVCPEPNCVHHDPSRALGDLTGIKKHFCRKHGEKKWKCDKCSKRYAVQSDWKAHAKICGTREYRCDCGTIFSRNPQSEQPIKIEIDVTFGRMERIKCKFYLRYELLCRKDSFVTHRAFCDALTEENYKMNQNLLGATGGMLQTPAASDHQMYTSPPMPASDSFTHPNTLMNLSVNNSRDNNTDIISPLNKPLSLNSHGGVNMMSSNLDPIFNPTTTRGPCFNSPLGIGSAAYTSATALLQKASEMGTKISDSTIAPILLRGFTGYSTTNTTTSMMNSSTTVQEALAEATGGCNMGPIINGLYVGNPEIYPDKNIGAGDQRLGYQVYSSSNGTSTRNDLLEREALIGSGGSEKMRTLDFLGVEPPTTTGLNSTFAKKRSFDGHNIMGLGYNTNSQQSLHNMHPEW